MKKLDKSLINDQVIVPKEEQRELLSNNKAPARCSSLGYNAIESTNKLNRAFDILFEEVFKSIT